MQPRPREEAYWRLAVGGAYYAASIVAVLLVIPTWSILAHNEKSDALHGDEADGVGILPLLLVAASIILAIMGHVTLRRAVAGLVPPHGDDSKDR